MFSASGIVSVAAPESQTSFLSVYLREGTAAPPDPVLSVTAKGLDLAVVGTPALLTPRTVLLLVDPGSYEGDVIRKRVDEMGRAISRVSREISRPIVFRLGIPVLDGVLGRRLAGDSDIATELAAMLESYLPDSQVADESHFGRTLDLMTAVLRMAEQEDGPVDLIILARDRRIAGEHAEYLAASIERQVLDLSSREGSTLYGFLSGSGILEKSILASGGAVFSDRQSGETVVRSVVGWQQRGYLVEVLQKGFPESGTRFPLSLQGHGSDRSPIAVRSATVLWRHPEGQPVPDQYHVGQGLDWIRRAGDAEKDGNLTLAMRFLENSLRDDKWNPETYYLTGKVALADGMLPIAGAHLLQAVHLDSSKEHILTLFGRVFEKLGRAEEALGVFRAALQAGLRPTPALSLQQARLLSAVHRYEAAADLYAALLNSGEEEDTVRAEYGGILWKLGRSTEALQQLGSALTLRADNMTALMNSSAIAIAQGRVEDAVGFATRALQVDSQNADAHITAGNALVAEGNWDRAAGHYRSAHTLAPGRNDVMNLLVGSLQNSGQEHEAVEILRRHLQTHPVDAEAYRKLAEVQTSTGEIFEAVSTLESGSARVPRRADTLFREAAELRERRGEYGQALLNYRAMLLASPPELARSRGSDLSHHLSYLKLLLGGKLSEPEASSEPPASPTPPRTESAAMPVPEKSPPAGMVIPGGLNLLARTLGVQSSLLTEADAAERIFSFMIEMSSSHSEKVQDNPIRRDVMAYLRHYGALLKHLQKQGLFPGDFDPVRGQEFVFYLNSEGDSFKRTQKLLRFFGISVKRKRERDGTTQITLVMKQNRGALERQTLLRNMGTNLLDRNLEEIRFVLKDDHLPILLGERMWSERILSREKSKSLPLLGRIVDNHRALRLYLALAGCSESTRSGLVQTANGEDLLKLADALGLYGRYLEYVDGKLVLPGSTKAWEALIGHPVTESARFIGELLSRDGGRGLMLYYALTLSAEPVQQILTFSGARLTELYGLLSSYYTSRLSRGPGVIAGRDLGSFFRRLSADEQGIYLDVDQRFADYILPSGATKATGPGLRVPVEQLEDLLRTAGQSSGGPLLPVVPRLEFIQYLQASYPESLQADMIQVIMEDPEQSRLFLDLIWDLGLPPDRLVDYIRMCGGLASAGSRGWNVDRTRTTQSLVHLISLMYRQGSLPKEVAWDLFGTMLGRLSASDEAGFAFEVAGFLSEALFPALESTVAPGPAELLLRALAGSGRVHTFSFEGKQLQFDPVAYKLHRMEGTIQHQRYTPLHDLLEIYRLLRTWRDGKTEPEALDTLSRAISGLRDVEQGSVSTSALKEAVARADVAGLVKKLEAARSKGARAAGAELANEIAATLHRELGLTLLSYCYAYHGSPETDALAFDPNFIRKHSFYSEAQGKNGKWRQALLEQRDGVGVHIVGSLSALGFELSSLETSQAVQSFGKREGRTLVPTILSGFRAMRRSMLSDRTQEYVALSVRMGREVLALSGTDNEAGSWCESELRRMVPPRRRERILSLVGEGNAGLAAEILSPSELLALGEKFRKSYRSSASLTGGHGGSTDLAADGSGDLENGGTVPVQWETSESTRGETTSGSVEGVECPVLGRLMDLTPKAETAEAARLRRELQEYGVLLRKRIGLNQLSLLISDSYEQLETGAAEEVLYERICDLKLRMAELNHALGLPAFLAEVEGELAVRDILPQNAAIRTNNWKLALEQIGRLGFENAAGWVEELLNRGILTVANGAEAGR